MAKEKANKAKFKLFKDKKSMWITIGFFALMIVIALVMLNINSRLPEQFDPAVVEADAKEAIEYFNAREYQSIIDMSEGLLDESMTAEQMAAQCDELLDELGSLKEYTDVKLVGATGKDADDVFGCAIIGAEYENGKASFTVVFNEEMQLAQFYVQ